MAEWGAATWTLSSNRRVGRGIFVSLDVHRTVKSGVRCSLFDCRRFWCSVQTLDLYSWDSFTLTPVFHFNTKHQLPGHHMRTPCCPFFSSASPNPLSTPRRCGRLRSATSFRMPTAKARTWVAAEWLCPTHASCRVQGCRATHVGTNVLCILF